jgi:hypothetical protein
MCPAFSFGLHRSAKKRRKIKMKALGKVKTVGMAALALGMTLAMATGSSAQTGRDSPQQNNGTMGSDGQKGGSMGQKGSTTQMQNGNMQKGNMGSSGTMNK